MNILYILNNFPKLSETFVLNEITQLVDLGHKVYIVGFYKPNKTKTHDKVKEYDLIKKTKYLTPVALKISNIIKDLLTFGRGIKLLFEDRKIEKLKFLKLIYQNDKNTSFLRKITSLLYCWETIKFIEKKDIKHIHCHFASENIRLAYLINKITKIPYTFTTHAIDIFYKPSKDIKKWADDAKKVITISNYNKQYMHYNFGIPLEKIEVIHCGMCMDEFKPVKKYNHDKFRIVSVCRFIEKKGISYLIEACKILKNRDKSFSCEIVGKGPLEREFIKLIKNNNLKGNVKLKKPMKHNKIMRFIQTGSVCVLPCIKASNNDMDGIPVVLMESMAMDIPTISTDISGIPELIDNSVNGIIVPQKDASALADAILKIKEDRGFAEKVRKKSREKIEDKFNIKKNVKKLVEVFEG